MYVFLVLKDIIFDFVYFPFWWYTRGFYNFLLGVIDFIIKKEKALLLSVWVKNLFVPMYGQYDIAGFFISFFVRLVQIFFRSAVLLFWICLGMLTILLWMIVPFLAAYMIFLQLDKK